MRRRPVVVAGVLVLVGLMGCVLPEGTAPSPRPTPPAGEALGPVLRPVALFPEGRRVIDWVGKVVDLETDLGVGGEHRSVFVPQTGQGYFILLENAALEELEKHTRHGEKLVKVSGTVSLYQGRNYLLLSRWQRQEY